MWGRKMTRAQTLILFVVAGLLAALFASTSGKRPEMGWGSATQTAAKLNGRGPASGLTPKLDGAVDPEGSAGGALREIERDESRLSAVPVARYLVDVEVPLISGGVLREASVRIANSDVEHDFFVPEGAPAISTMDVSSFFEEHSAGQDAAVAVELHSDGVLLDKAVVSLADFREGERHQGTLCYRASLLLRSSLSETKIVGMLRDTANKPIIGACVAILESIPGRRPRALKRVSTDSRGRFAVYLGEEGAGLLAIVSDGHLPELVHVRQRPDALVDLGALRLSEGLAVSGRVQTGSPTLDGEEFQVVLERAANGLDFEIEDRRLMIASEKLEFIGSTVVAGADGRFECRGMTADKYAVYSNGAARGASSLSGWSHPKLSVRPPSSNVIVEVDRPILRWKILAGAQPLGRAKISLDSHSGAVQCFTGSDGRAKALVNMGERVHVRVDAEGFWSEQRVVDVESHGAGSEMVVEMQPASNGADLHVLAWSVAGKPIIEITADLFEVGASDRIPLVRLQGRDAAGEYSWSGIRPGRYGVLIRAESGSSSGMFVPVQREVLLTETAVAEEHIVMAMGGRVKIRIRDHIGYTSVAPCHIMDSTGRRVDVTFVMEDRARSFAHVSRDTPHPDDAKRNAFAEFDGAIPPGDYKAVVLADEDNVTSVAFSVVAGETSFVKIDLPKAAAK